eukprot:8614371-Pyramimonas_sp.AAC.1
MHRQRYTSCAASSSCPKISPWAAKDMPRNAGLLAMPSAVAKVKDDRRVVTEPGVRTGGRANANLC